MSRDEDDDVDYGAVAFSAPHENGFVQLLRNKAGTLIGARCSCGWAWTGRGYVAPTFILAQANKHRCPPPRTPEWSPSLDDGAGLLNR